MIDEGTGRRLRQELAKARQAKGFNKYPAILRDEAMRYAQSRRKQGIGVSLIAKELGVAITTVDAWSGPDGRRSTVRIGGHDARQSSIDKLSLVPVVVQPEPTRRVLSRLEVDFGDGTRLQATGIAAEDLARAIELLRRSS